MKTTYCVNTPVNEHPTAVYETLQTLSHPSRRRPGRDLAVALLPAVLEPGRDADHRRVLHLPAEPDGHLPALARLREAPLLLGLRDGAPRDAHGREVVAEQRARQLGAARAVACTDTGRAREQSAPGLRLPV